MYRTQHILTSKKGCAQRLFADQIIKQERKVECDNKQTSTLSECSLKSKGRGFPLNFATSLKIFSASSNRSCVNSHLALNKYRYEINNFIQI